jgi:hypothetical protein
MTRIGKCQMFGWLCYITSPRVAIMRKDGGSLYARRTAVQILGAAKGVAANNNWGINKGRTFSARVVEGGWKMG